MYKGIILLLVVLFFSSMINGYRDCAASGGNYVRGILWMECVE